MKLWAANDAEPRDPASYELYGTNVLLGAGPFATSDFTLIASGTLALPTSRNAGGAATLDDINSQTVDFLANATAYTSYMIVFPTVKDAGAANSMQIAEIQLDGVVGGSVDTDGDGLPDAYENSVGLDPTKDGSVGESSPGAGDGPDGPLGDPDGDTLTNEEERDLGTLPKNSDSDGDGYADNVEDNGGVYLSATQTGTSPTNDDSDGDGLLDGAENPGLPFVDENQPGTDPNQVNTDGDGLNDLDDILAGRDPTVHDDPPPMTTYENNFDTPDGTTSFADNSLLVGNANFSPSAQGNELQLTATTGSNNSAFHIPALLNSSQGWTATFDVRINEPAGGNPPADGFSLCYGAIPWGSLSDTAEEGFPGVPDVLSFEVDTWRVDDTEVGPAIGLNRPAGIAGFSNSLHTSSLAFTNGNILLDGQSVTGSVTISWNPSDGASFSTTGFITNADFTNIPTPGFAGDDDWTFAVVARTGGAFENLFIDNLVIMTGAGPKMFFNVSTSPGDPASLLMEWNGRAGKLYDIRSVGSDTFDLDDPATHADPSSWPLFLENLTPAQAVGVVPPRPADAERLFVLVEKEGPPFFSEDFESGQGGWITSVNDADNNTRWELGTPVASTGPTTGAGGSTICFTTNLGDYGVDSDISLRSPVIDLTGAGLTGATLRMDQYRDADAFADTATVRILRAGDSTVLASLDADLGAFDPDWSPASFNLAAGIGEMIILEFNFTSDFTDDPFSGWSIDNVEVVLD